MHATIPRTLNKLVPKQRESRFSEMLVNRNGYSEAAFHKGLVSGQEKVEKRASCSNRSSSYINMNETTISSSLGVNRSNKTFSQDEISSYDYELPSDLTEISDSSLLGVFAYSVVFVVVVFGHLFALSTLWKRYKVKKSRIFLLLLHLSLADLIVCLVIVPTEIFWRLIVQWEGGDFLCKAVQYFRAFGLYLSSIILMCLSVDRFISIVFPLKVIGTLGYQRIKWMIIAGWIAAALFSVPQVILFRVEYHPRFPSYKQCVTSAFHDEENFNIVKYYSIFSIVVMYIVPLLVIVFTCTAIFVKLLLKSIEQRTGSSQIQSDTDLQGENSVSSVVNQDGVVSVYRMQSTFQLRSSNNARVNLSRAKMRTLLMTFVIVFAFIVCWTPFAVMTFWYIIDWEVAENVDPRIQDALFLMVVANSCINPLIYGGFSYRTSGRSRWCYFF